MLLSAYSALGFIAKLKELISPKERGLPMQRNKQDNIKTIIEISKDNFIPKCIRKLMFATCQT